MKREINEQNSNSVYQLIHQIINYPINHIFDYRSIIKQNIDILNSIYQKLDKKKKKINIFKMTVVNTNFKLIHTIVIDVSIVIVKFCLTKTV